MLNEHLTRQSDIIPHEILGSRINVIGAGAIGSFSVLQLAKMGFYNIHVWDHDMVSIENMSCQFYRFKDIGSKKSLALQDLVNEFTGIKIKANECHYEDGFLPGVVISAVDSMKVRKKIWDNHKAKSFNTHWIIDPRMSALDACLNVACPMDASDWDYEKTLYLDSDSVQERCTAKSTMFTVNMISGLVVKTTVDCLKGLIPIKSAQWSILHNDLVSHKRGT